MHNSFIQPQSHSTFKWFPSPAHPNSTSSFVTSEPYFSIFFFFKLKKPQFFNLALFGGKASERYPASHGGAHAAPRHSAGRRQRAARASARSIGLCAHERSGFRIPPSRITYSEPSSNRAFSFPMTTHALTISLLLNAPLTANYPRPVLCSFHRAKDILISFPFRLSNVSFSRVIVPPSVRVRASCAHERVCPCVRTLVCAIICACMFLRLSLSVSLRVCTCVFVCAFVCSCGYRCFNGQMRFSKWLFLYFVFRSHLNLKQYLHELFSGTHTLCSHIFKYIKYLNLSIFAYTFHSYLFLYDHVNFKWSWFMLSISTAWIMKK